MAEGARLELVYTLIAYRGFESLPLRHFLFVNQILTFRFPAKNSQFLVKKKLLFQSPLLLLLEFDLNLPSVGGKG